MILMVYDLLTFIMIGLQELNALLLYVKFASQG